jgi:hypothetical protein
MNFKIKIFAKELIKKKRRLRMKQLQLKIIAFLKNKLL